jgi:hypothetical protein
MSIYNTTITSTTGPCNVVTYDGSTLVTYSSLLEMTEFFEFVLNILGIDLTYEEFKEMSESDKKTFLRDLKIKTVLNGLQ